jgi:hypothetical protein
MAAPADSPAAAQAFAFAVLGALGGDDPHSALGPLGLSNRNAAGRMKLRNMKRLMLLIGSKRGLGSTEEDCVSTRLEALVLHGGDVDNITDAREKVSWLTWCGRLMLEDVRHLIDHPEDRVKGFNLEKAQGLSEMLQKLVIEFEARAGEPNELNSEQAERMRCKMEKRLVPTLKAEIPKWAEQLRFLLPDVIEYLEADPMLEEEAPEPEPEPKKPPTEQELELWTTRDEDQAPVDEEEMEILKKMGWSPDDAGGCGGFSTDDVAAGSGVGGSNVAAPGAEDGGAETASSAAASSKSNAARNRKKKEKRKQKRTDSAEAAWSGQGLS